MDQKYIVAFEIGSSCIKGAIATTDAGSTAGRVNIIAVETEPLVDKVRYGCVENPGDVATCVTAICHRLQAVAGVAPRVIRGAYVGISGRSLCSVPCEVARDFHSEVEISRRIIDDLMQKAATNTVPDKEVIAVEPGTFTLDNQTSLDPVGMLGHILTANVSLVACKPKIRNNIKRVFNERCSLAINGYIVTPLAQGAQLLTQEERRLGVMLVDFGAETTTVAIYRDGSLIYLATIPMGSRNITRDITSLNCLEEKAEEIKKAVGNAMPPATNGNPLVTDGLDNSDINNIVAARADEIISNIFEQITYADLRPEQLPAGIVVTGGGSRLRGFTDLLAKQTHIKVRQASLGPGVNIVGNGFNAADALDVISIVCDAAMLDAVDCTMLPPNMVTEPVSGIDNPSQPVSDTGHHDNISRIGSLDDDSDDDILSDDDDPADKPSLAERAESIKKKDKPKKDDRKETRPAENKHSSGFWNSISNTLSNMLKDDSELDN